MQAYAATGPDVQLLAELERKLLWLSTWTISARTTTG